ncbi:hypothetical protein [Bradyrhizobium sp. 146]|uniref:hypothetical protein n=1 Tax=Bradyrhizobium sp. 146 TaxID=2782622 RepID=UPI001FF9667D|nr:hypothetical protein [Bradyrhizobium sp. 146]
MNDLGEPVHGFIEPVVEAMDEYKDSSTCSRLLCGRRQRSAKCRFFGRFGRDRHEV